MAARGGVRPRLILIGGFLGAGKTTAVRRLAVHLADQGIRVGLISNDQGRNLVDTEVLRSGGFATEEIAGGCFCCRFDDLVGATKRLSSVLPIDVFIAEPVGSCTDLGATVVAPLRRLYGDRLDVAPLSVLLDPLRAEALIGLADPGPFSDEVDYIRRKQLEEADLVVITKIDLLTEARATSISDALGRAFPSAEVVAVSVREGRNLEPWFERVLFGSPGQRPTLTVDYDRYARGEARLGWLNATVAVVARPSVGDDALLGRLAGAIRERLGAAAIAVAHLKASLTPDDASPGEVAAISLVRNEAAPELVITLARPVASGRGPRRSSNPARDPRAPGPHRVAPSPRSRRKCRGR